MTLDEAIEHCEEVAEELKEVNMAELDLMYAGDTECIDEHKDRCLDCAKDHEQLAEWLKELKQLREQKNYIDEAKEKMQAYSHTFTVLHRSDLASAVDNCINILDRAMKGEVKE